VKGDLPSRFTGLDDSPGFLLWQVANAWQRRQRQALEGIGLTHVQFVLLAGIDWLGQAESPMTQATLARYARVDEMMTSQVIRILEKRGAVEREPHPSDSRAKCLRLTEKGADLLARAYPLFEQTDESFFKVEGAKLPELLDLLRTITHDTRRGEDANSLKIVDGQSASISADGQPIRST